MATTNRTTIVGVFHDRQQANRAVEELKQLGFRDDQIGVAARHTESGDATATEHGSLAEEGALTGALAGAGLGALVGLGIIAGVIPAIGPVIAGGTLAALLANAAGGAAIAGLAGALIGAGIPEEEASYYQDQFEAGRIIVTVKANGRADEATAILRKYGAYDMHTEGTSLAEGASRARAAVSGAERTTTSGPTGTATGRPVGTSAGQQTIKVHEEQLHAHKQPVEAGEVRVHKEIVTETKTLEVPVTREEVVIERRPASGRSSSSEFREGEEVRIPVKEEQVHVEKEAVVTEEVTVGKRTVHDTQQVSGTVRKEQVKVEREGTARPTKGRRTES